MDLGYLAVKPIIILSISILCFASTIVFFLMDKQKNRTLNMTHVIVLLFFAILTPPLVFSESLPAIRLEMIMVGCTWVFLLYCHCVSRFKIEWPYTPVNVNKWFLFFGLSMFLSIGYATLFLGQQLILRDLYELLKLLLYFLIFILIARAKLTVLEIKRIYFFTLLIIMVSALFAIAQYLNLANINEWLTPYFTSPTQMPGLVYIGRVTGTLPNPNEFGAMLILASALAISGLLHFRRNNELIFCGFCLVVYFSALSLTLSRSSVIALCVVAIVLLIINYSKIIEMMSLKTVIIITFTLFLISIIFKALLPEEFFTRIGDLLNISQVPSWIFRLDKWSINISIWQESPVFGWGPAKVDMTTIVDNEWLLLLRRYGIVGVVAFIGLLVSFLRGLQQLRAENSDETTTALAGALTATLIGYMVYMITASIYHSLQLMPILLIMLGLAFSTLQES
jgi:O-antigen ligase